MKKLNFTVVIEQDDETGLYVADVPALPACHTQEKTMDELMENVREVIELCLEVQKEKSLHVPKCIGIQQVEAAA